MKKILIDGSALKNNRGSSSYLKTLIEGMSKLKYSKKFELILVVPFSLNKSLSTINNFKIIYRPFFNKIVWDLVLLPFYCWREKGHLLHNTENTSGVLLQKLFGFKSVTTIFDVSYHKPFNISPRPKYLRQWIGFFYRRLYSKKAAKITSKIITVSNFAKRDIIKHLEVIPKKIKVIYLGIPKIFFSKKISHISSKKKFHEKKNIIIVTGSSNQKNFDKTFEYLKINKNIIKGWKLNIIGIEGKNSDFAKFFGNINRRRIINLYDKSSILIMPSLYESFALPLAEALSRGLLVISSNRGAAKEIMRSNAIFYNPKSCRDFKKALTEAIKSWKHIKLKKIKKQIDYASYYSEENLALKTLDVYNEVLT